MASNLEISPEALAGPARPAGLLFDFPSLDAARPHLTRQDLERWNPHRGALALLDAILWASDDLKRAVAVKHVRPDEFWVAGHFPSRPMLPGVLMVEAGAQLASYLFYRRQSHDKGVSDHKVEDGLIAGFTRINEASFRGIVEPGDALIILGREVKYQLNKRFISDVQGLVDGRIVFDARVTGMLF